MTTPDRLADRYRLVRLAHEGRHYDVWDALDEGGAQPRRVAVKRTRVPPDDFTDEYFESVQYARTDAVCTSRTESSHVCMAFDFGQDDERRVFGVYEWIDGAPLPRQRMTWRHDALVVIGGVTDVVANAHAIGIAHRDLRPENVLVARRDDRGPRAVVIGFGNALVEHRATPDELEQAKQADLEAMRELASILLGPLPAGLAARHETARALEEAVERAIIAEQS